MRVNTSQTISTYYSICNSFNENKPLADQLRTERNTGHLLLVLLCNELVRTKKSGCILYTNVKSVSKQTCQSTKTVKRHLKTLNIAGIIQEYGLTKYVFKRNKFKVVFNAKIIQYSDDESVDKVLISEQALVDNYLNGLEKPLHSEITQVTDIKQIVA